MNKKVCLIGHGRHGKDTVAELMKKLFGYTFKGSSLMASEIFLYKALKNKYGYTSPEQCFEDRSNHRTEWHDLISAYNEADGSRLAAEILKKADMYVGMRSDRELQTCKEKGLFDLVIGVFDPGKPLEDPSSFNIDLWNQADLIIPNKGTLEELEARVKKLQPLLQKVSKPVITTGITGIGLLHGY